MPSTLYPGSDHPYNPFHSNNLSGTVGGPIIPHHQFFFFFGIEALRSSASTGNNVILSRIRRSQLFAQANNPGTFGTTILNTYVPTHVVGVAVSKTANDISPELVGL